MLGVSSVHTGPGWNVTWVSLLFFPAKKWGSGMKILPPGVKDGISLRQGTFPLSPRTFPIAEARRKNCMGEAEKSEV